MSLGPDIDAKTSISLYSVLAAAVVVIPLIIGGIIWLTTIDAKASAAQEEIRGLKTLILDVRERLIRIEEHQKQGEK